MLKPMHQPLLQDHIIADSSLSVQQTKQQQENRSLVCAFQTMG
jgi:hypothetical protein